MSVSTHAPWSWRQLPYDVGYASGPERARCVTAKVPHRGETLAFLIHVVDDRKLSPGDPLPNKFNCGWSAYVTVGVESSVDGPRTYRVDPAQDDGWSAHEPVPIHTRDIARVLINRYLDTLVPENERRDSEPPLIVVRVRTAAHALGAAALLTTDPPNACEPGGKRIDHPDYTTTQLTFLVLLVWSVTLPDGLFRLVIDVDDATARETLAQTNEGCCEILGAPSQEQTLCDGSDGGHERRHTNEASTAAEDPGGIRLGERGSPSQVEPIAEAASVTHTATETLVPVVTKRRRIVTRTTTPTTTGEPS